MRTVPTFMPMRHPHYPERLPVQRGGFSYYGTHFTALGDAYYLYDEGRYATYIVDAMDDKGNPCRLYMHVGYRDVEPAKEGKLAWARVLTDMERLVPDAWRVKAVTGTFNVAPEMEPGDVRSMDDLRRFYMVNHPWTAPYLEDPEVWGWICDYYGYLAMNEHGNQPSLVEDAKEGYMASLLMDLVEQCDSHYTDYLAAWEEVDEIEERERSLLDRRARIQKRFGVKPDWKGSANRRSSKLSSKNRRSVLRRR